MGITQSRGRLDRHRRRPHRRPILGLLAKRWSDGPGRPPYDPLGCGRDRTGATGQRCGCDRPLGWDSDDGAVAADPIAGDERGW